MGLRINTNIPSLSAQRTLEANSGEQSKTLTRLSSGQRVVNAGDDAAGLAIGNNLNAQLKGLWQAKRNANDGISLVQTAEGSLNEISNILIRMRELGVQAASDTIGDDERGYLNQESQQLKEEVERIAQSTTFNGRPLLNGESAESELHFQVGINGSAANQIKFDTKTAEVTTSTLGIDGISVSARDDATSSLEVIDNAIKKLNSNRASLGAMQNRLQSTNANLGSIAENVATAKSRILDADYGRETSELVKQNILTSANISVLSQANSTPAQALKLI